MIYEENLMDLFAAIYKLAVKDDYKRVVEYTFVKLVKDGIDKSQARNYIRDKSDYIRKTVMNNVYQEAKEYGPDTLRIRRENIRNLVNHLVETYPGIGG